MKIFLQKFWVEMTSDKRIQALIWHTLAMIVAYVVDYFIANLASLPIGNPIVATALGLVLGQASKAIHNTVNN